MKIELSRDQLLFLRIILMDQPNTELVQGVRAAIRDKLEARPCPFCDGGRKGTTCEDCCGAGVLPPGCDAHPLPDAGCGDCNRKERGL